MKNGAVLLLSVLIVAGVATTEEPAPVDLIVAEALERSQAYEILAHLSDDIGPRLAGSEGAEAAVKWTAATLESWGLVVRLEPVRFEKWVRGEERGSLVSHLNQKIVLTALGRSVATPAEGITAEVIEASTLDDIDRIGDAARGKIVLYNQAMDMDLIHARRSFEAYGKAVSARGAGASRAAKYGAVAALVRSVASASLRSPHTGAMRYDDEFPTIPAAAVSTEDADLIHRLLAKGQSVRMHLVLTPEFPGEFESANVVADWKGSELPDEIVLIGGHLDSWDLGTGAIDNGSGVAGVMETVRILSSLGLRPKRTIRVVLFMNEEYGLSGGRAYHDVHEGELTSHFATIESDAGATLPLGFDSTLSDERLGMLAKELEPLMSLGAGSIRFGSERGVGADTGLLSRAGVPGFGLRPDSRYYFDYHHSAADTLDKIDPEELARNAAAIAVMTWILADMDGRLVEGR